LPASDSAAAAHHGHAAELAADHGRVAGGAAGFGDDAARDQHAVNVVGTGVVAYQDDILAAVGGIDRGVNFGVGPP
jgi:hypothetical protein